MTLFYTNKNYFFNGIEAGTGGIGSGCHSCLSLYLYKSRDKEFIKEFTPEWFSDLFKELERANTRFSPTYPLPMRLLGAFVKIDG